MSDKDKVVDLVEWRKAREAKQLETVSLTDKPNYLDELRNQSLIEKAVETISTKESTDTSLSEASQNHLHQWAKTFINKRFADLRNELAKCEKQLFKTLENRLLVLKKTY